MDLTAFGKWKKKHDWSHDLFFSAKKKNWITIFFDVENFVIYDIEEYFLASESSNFTG